MTESKFNGATEYQFFEDPGHGWLAVSLHELVELKLIKEISSCSYISKDRQTIYLEEDQDAGTFMRAKFGEYEFNQEAWREFYDTQVTTIYCEGGRIRNLDYYNLCA